jgi:hypothetical protein
MKARARAALISIAILYGGDAAAQVQVRVGVPGRATYSELHEALREDSPAADSISAIMRSKSPGPLWRELRRTVEGKGDWNTALLSLTRLAQLRSRIYADSAGSLLQRLESGASVPFPSDPGLKPEDLEPSLQAIVLERRRAVRGDSTVLADILAGSRPGNTTTATRGSWAGSEPGLETPWRGGFKPQTARSSGCGISHCFPILPTRN